MVLKTLNKSVETNQDLDLWHQQCVPHGSTSLSSILNKCCDRRARKPRNKVHNTFFSLPILKDKVGMFYRNCTHSWSFLVAICKACEFHHQNPSPIGFLLILYLLCPSPICHHLRPRRIHQQHGECLRLYSCPNNLNSTRFLKRFIKN
jgi:hypothetical protein